MFTLTLLGRLVLRVALWVVLDVIYWTLGSVRTGNRAVLLGYKSAVGSRLRARKTPGKEKFQVLVGAEVQTSTL